MAAAVVGGVVGGCRRRVSMWSIGSRVPMRLAVAAGDGWRGSG